MDKYFICLANSDKRIREPNDGRCIAGIEVTISESADNKFEIFPHMDQDRPNWIRPSANNETGAIPIRDAIAFNLFDVIKISNVKNIRDGAHTEDFIYDTIEKVGFCTVDEEWLSQFCEHRDSVFGDGHSFVTHEEFILFDHSLMLIKPVRRKFFFEEREDVYGRPHRRLRCRFVYGSYEYNLRVTDPKFRQSCYDLRIGDEQLTTINATNNNYYFVMSLGIAFQKQGDNHYKLIASVIQV